MIRGKFDFSQVKQLTQRFETLASDKAIESFIRECLFDLSKTLVAKTKWKTPVNTGLLRNSWKIGEIGRQGDNYVVTVYTDLEYAHFVENGFRAHFVPGEWKSNQFVYDPLSKTGMFVGKPGGWVEGKFMMKFSVKELERELPNFLAQKQRNFLNRIMKG